MSTEDSTYAPRSPDLSFLSGSDLPSNSAELPQIPPPTSLYYQKATDRVPVALELGATQSQPHHHSQLGYQPQPTEVQSKPTSTPAAGAGPVFINNHNHNHHHHQQFAQYPNQPYPFHQQAIPQPHAPSYPPQPHSPTLSNYGTLQTSSTPRSYYPPYSGPTSAATHYPTSQPQSTNSPYSPPTNRDQYYQPQTSASGHPVSQSQGAQPYFLAAQETVLYGQQFPIPDHPHSSAMPPRKAAQVAAKQPEIMQSPVRTKFPTARIKRIMQADEEVGKVAQQTPIAVGKALELFMVQLVSKSAEVAKERNSKRITAQMLKQAVESANEWDFLQEIVAKVSEKEETSRGAGKTRQESDSDEEVDVGEVKKRGRGGRKKKVAA